MLWRKSRAFLFILVFVLINDLHFKGKTKEEWKIIEEYLKEYIGKYYEISETAEKVYIGKDFPDEFTHGKDKTVLKGPNLKAKANAAQAVGELIQIAENKSMSEDFGLDNDIRVSTLSKYPEVFSMEEQTVDEEQIWSGLSKAIRGAAQNLAETRITEGANLAQDLIAKLQKHPDHENYIEITTPERFFTEHCSSVDALACLLRGAQFNGE